LPTVVT